MTQSFLSDRNEYSPPLTVCRRCRLTSAPGGKRPVISNVARLPRRPYRTLKRIRSAATEAVFRNVTSYVAISTNSKLESPPLQVEIVTGAGDGAGPPVAGCAAAGATVERSAARHATVNERIPRQIGRTAGVPLGGVRPL
jgi:hypothetical protein